MDIYDRIKKRRLDLNLTQSELAKKMGFQNHSAIAKIEAKQRDITESKVIAFAKALETTPAWLKEGSIEQKINRMLKKYKKRYKCIVFLYFCTYNIYVVRVSLLYKCERIRRCFTTLQM